MRPALPPGPFGVIGLGRSGVAAARALHARGEQVIAFDSGAPEVGALEGIDVRLNSDSLDPRVVTLIKSPGVPADHPAVLAARARGLAVLGELELAWRLLPNEFIAITGTNGKTTTTELVGHIHRTAGVPAVVAGNVGLAVSALVGELDGATTVICECSSFQLEDTAAFAPQVAVLLNLAPDHLDRHASFERYVAAKLEAFARQREHDIAVVPDDFALAAGAARRVRFGAGAGAELRDDDGRLWWRGEPLAEHAEIRLRGPHNRQNAMAAAAVCLARGLAAAAVREGLATFAGVPHRLEEVARHRGVLYVNDSKATNVASTLVALRSFDPGTVHAILGGQGKGQDFGQLRDEVARRCAGAYLIGEDAPLIAAALAGLDGVRECGGLEAGVAAARRAAREGEVVLLSPACASFDQFRDFEDRGERFRELVR